MNTQTVDRTKTADHSLITASRVKGEPVFNLSGDRIGHIEDLSVQKASGQVIYALMSFGGFLGVGEKIHPLPWSVLKYDEAKGGYIVPLEKAQLENAPSYAKDELDAFGGRDHSYRDAVFSYYGPHGAVPYWQPSPTFI